MRRTAVVIPACALRCARAKRNCPAIRPVRYRAIFTSLSASRLPPFASCQMGPDHAPCTGSLFNPPSHSLPGSGCHRPGGVLPSIGAASVRHARPCSVGHHPGVLPGWPTSVLPVSRNPVRQRLGTERGASFRGGSPAGIVLMPAVIRCRFRSTVAVPIPFTRVRSSTRRKGPCCRRYATIASARLGPTFASPCSSIDASAVLMSIRSAAKAGHINSIPSASAFHETQGPTVKLLVTWKQCLPTFPSAETVSRATYTQPIVHCAFTQPAKYPT